jgi:hypothetical protein
MIEFIPIKGGLMRTLAALLIAISFSMSGAAQSGDQDCTFKWFTKDRDGYIKRLGAVRAEDIIAWHKVGSAGPVPTITADEVYDQLAWFNPLWSADHQPVTGAVAKYSNRLSQLPASAVDQMSSVVRGPKFRAALSLVAEDALFPGEKYSANALAGIAAKCK